MSYEIGQLDIPDRELLPARARPRASMSMEIGEAVVTHTIFGRAKVRIIRKHYSAPRTFLLTVTAVLAAAAAAAWLEWIASQRAGMLQGADAAPPARASVRDAPLVQPENIPVPAALPAANEPAAPSPTGTGDPALSQQVAPQAAQGLDATAAPIPARPARRPKPSAASTPDASDAPTNQADRPRLPTQQSAKQTAPAAATPAAPAVKEDAPTPSPAVAGQAANPAQP